MTEDLRNVLDNGASGDIDTRRFTVLTRHGHPLLYLPRERAQALQALSLYPAQRAKARMARRLMHLICAAGLTPLLPSTTLVLRSDAPLIQFLKGLFDCQTVPAMAILAGNPNAPGRRFIMLLFDGCDRPHVVVKAGLSPEAIRLLGQEVAVLDQIPLTALGVPRLRAAHRQTEFHAFAIDYAEGDTPEAGTSNRLAEVLTSWMDTIRTVTARDVPAWKRLTQACPADPTLQVIRSRIESSSFHPVLYHGDFAPWNIKVARDGSWQVLDWERGERTGLPCWDWFHYHVQTCLLVDRLSAEAHTEHIHGWLATDLFRSYAAHAGVEPIVRELLVAYLLYSLEITQPSEGLQATRDLLIVLLERWSAALKS